MKITAFAGSNSSNSINKKLVTYTASLFQESQIEILDLNDFDIPLYGIDLENDKGIPQPVIKFSNIIKESDLLIISLAEHNGAYTAVFKNLFDWLSRVDGTKAFHKKPIFLMATSPGGRGGINVLELAKGSFSHSDGIIIETYSLPSFSTNFNEETGIVDESLNTDLFTKIKNIQTQLKS